MCISLHNVNYQFFAPNNPILFHNYILSDHCTAFPFKNKRNLTKGYADVTEKYSKTLKFREHLIFVQTRELIKLKKN